MAKSIVQKALTNEFSLFNLQPEIINTLDKIRVINPTLIQKSVLPLILNGNSVIFADQTGTGKTFSVLLGIIDRICKILLKSESHLLPPGSPIALMVTPTCELAHQTLKAAKQFSHTARFASAGLFKNYPLKSQKLSLSKGPHFVVGTPGSIWKHLEMGSLKLSSIKIAAFDEVDELFDRKFITHSRRLIDECSNSFLSEKTPFDKTQFIAFSSTLQTKNLEFVQKEFPKTVSTLITKSHQTPPPAAFVKFIELKGRDKMQSFLNLIEKEKISNGGALKMTLVFTNSIKSCLAVHTTLLNNGHDALAFHSEMELKDRKQNLEAWSAGAASLLVSTGLAGRGLDTQCRHVILFDFPVSVTEYLHRIGRTARLGQNGRVTALLYGSDMSFAKKIALCHDDEKALINLSSERKESLMMRTVVKNKEIDHTSQFWPEDDDRLSNGNGKTCRSEDTYSRRANPNNNPYKSPNDLTKLKNAVTNSRSGLKWFYAKNTEDGERKGRVPRDIKDVPKVLKKDKK